MNYTLFSKIPNNNNKLLFLLALYLEVNKNNYNKKCK